MSMYQFSLPKNATANLYGLFGTALNVAMTGRTEAQGADRLMMLGFCTKPMGSRRGFLSIVRGDGFFNSDKVVAPTR